MPVEGNWDLRFVEVELVLELCGLSLDEFLDEKEELNFPVDWEELFLNEKDGDCF